MSAWEHPRETVCVLIADSHFDLRIGRCGNCGQHYVEIFTEFLNWGGRDDSQYGDTLPVSDQEAATFLAQGSNVDLRQIQELGEHRLRLKWDWPAEENQQHNYAIGIIPIMAGY